MSIDLMGLLKDAISRQAMSKIGGMIGLDGPATDKAFDGAAGTILGGMMKKTKTQQGIDQIFGVANQHDGGMFDNLGDLLGNSDAAVNLQKQGGGVLDLVFGEDRSKAETGVASSLGLSSGIVGKLMSLAGPMVMGIIGRYIKTKALNAVGLGSLLADQGSYLGNYVPSGLADNLGFSSFLGNAANTANSAVNSAADSVHRAGSTAGQAAKSGGGLMKMLLPLVLLGAIIWGLWQFVLSPMLNGENPVAGVTQTIGDAGAAVGDGISAAGDTIKGGADSIGDGISGAVGGIGGAIGGLEMPDLNVGNFNLDALGEAGPKLTSGINDVRSGFQNVITENTEEAANGLAGTINGFKDSLGDLNIGEMAAPAKTAASGMLNQFSTTIDALMEKLPEALQGIVRPAVDGLIEQINAITG
jgi:hypothetical protein